MNVGCLVKYEPPRLSFKAQAPFGVCVYEPGDPLGVRVYNPGDARHLSLSISQGVAGKGAACREGNAARLPVWHCLARRYTRRGHANEQKSQRDERMAA